MAGVADGTHPMRGALPPRDWPAWLGIGLMWCVAALPWRVQLVLGGALGRGMRHVNRRRARIARVNLALCLPEMPHTERERLLKQHFASLGIGLAEIALSWWGTGRRMLKLGAVEGLEHLEAALGHGRGVILLSAHFTTLEIGGRLLALHAPFHVMYRRHKNPVVEAVMKRARKRHYEQAIERGNLRAMLRSLKANMPVWYAPDQNYGREHSIFVPFFGVPAATITATSRLARMSGARVVPFFQERLSGGRGYRLVLQPALEEFPGADIEADARRINALIETQIRRTPAQYLWTHRRFKTRPPGERPVYD